MGRSAKSRNVFSRLKTRVMNAPRGFVMARITSRKKRIWSQPFVVMLEVFGAKQGYEQIAEKGDRNDDQNDVFEHRFAFKDLFEAFAGAKIEDCGGEEDECCDGKNCVVHEGKNKLRRLRKWSAVDKDFVREGRDGNDLKNHHGGSIEENFLSASRRVHGK